MIFTVFQMFERVHTCLLNETLSTIVERLVVKKV